MSKIIFRCLVHSGLLAAESFLILLSWLSPHEIFMQLIWCVTDKSLVRTSGTSMLKLLLLKKAILGWWLFQYLSMFGYYSKVLTAYQSAIYQQSAYIFNGLLENSQKVYGRREKIVRRNKTGWNTFWGKIVWRTNLNMRWKIIALMLQWRVSCINYKDYDLTTSGFLRFKACHFRKSAI